MMTFQDFANIFAAQIPNVCHVYINYRGFVRGEKKNRKGADLAKDLVSKRKKIAPSYAPSFSANHHFQQAKTKFKAALREREGERKSRFGF